MNCSYTRLIGLAAMTNRRFELSLFLLFTFACTQAFAQSAREKSLAIVEASLAMRAKFTKFSCEYDESETTVNKLEDIADRKFTQEPRIGKFSWYRSIDKESLFVIQDEKTTKMLKLAGERMAYEPMQILVSKSHYLMDIDFSAEMSKEPGKDTMPQPLFGCLRNENYGWDELHHLKKTLLSNKATPVVEQVLESGKTYSKISLPLPDSKITAAYWFDPDRGMCLAKYINKLSDPAETELFWLLLDSKEFQGRWFPMHIARGLKQKQLKDWQIHDSIVTSLKMDVEPNRSAFELTLAPKTWVHDCIVHRNSFFTQRAEKVHIDQLPELYKRVVEAGKLADRKPK